MEFEVGVVSDRNGQACAIPNFNLPMRQVGALGKEDGRSLAFVVGDGHLLVRQGSVVKKLAQDLSTELWRANVGPGFGVGSSDREAIVVVAEGARPILRVIDTTTGNLTRDLPMPNDASLVALVGPQRGAVLTHPAENGTVCVDLESGIERWRRAGAVGAVAAIRSGVLVVERETASLCCVDSATGEDRWRFKLPADSGPGVRALAVADRDGVVLVSESRHIWRLSPASGAVIADGHVRGERVVITDTQVVAGGARGLVAVDHRTMEEVERSEWEEDATRAYGRFAETCGFAVSATCAVWTTRSGMVMGALRHSISTKRKIWTHQIPQARFALGSRIVGYGDYLYVQPTQFKPSQDPPVLCCYARVPEGELSRAWGRARASTP